MQNGKFGNDIPQENAEYIFSKLGNLIDNFTGKKILLTGYRGFLGSNFLSFFHFLNKNLTNKVELICIDNLIVDLEDVTNTYSESFQILHGNVIDVLPDIDFDYVLHCAGIASPTFYRKFPLETIKVNAIEYWQILNTISTANLKGLLYFSTSEIYGDPNINFIPTKEDYRGNVSCTGPRACYDESKRLGETISVSMVKEKNIPVKIVRPFNVYGPFMRKNDRRVIPDFLKDGVENKRIVLYSDGTPTRAFCYVADAVEGFLRALLLGEPGCPYNIGNDQTEISMKNLARLVSDLLGDVKIDYYVNDQKDYLTDNPQRRCPVIKRAREELGYSPEVNLKTGLQNMIEWYRTQYYSDKVK